MRRRILGAVLALALAAAGTSVLVMYVRNVETRALAGERVVDVLVVREPVAAGSGAEELDGKVRVEQVPVKVQAIGSVASLDDLAGKVASVDLLPGEQVTTARFVTPQALAQASGVAIPDGMQAVTISLSPERALGGQLSPGDHIGVVASFTSAEVPQEGDPTATEGVDASSHLVLHRVLVTNIQGEPQPQSDGDRDPAPAAGFLVTVAIDAPAVERLVFAAEHGTVWFTLQPEATSTDGTRVQTRGTIFR